MITRERLVELLKSDRQVRKDSWEEIESNLTNKNEPTIEELEDLLQWGCIYNYSNLVKEILGEAINIDCETSNGKTPLLLASEKGYQNIVEMLLGKNANPDSQSFRGYTALMQACDRNYIKVASLLLRANARIDLKNKDNTTAKKIAKEKNHQEILKLLKTKSGFWARLFF